MKIDYPIKENEGPAAPQIAVSLVVDQTRVEIDCAYWPVKDSAYHQSVCVPLDSVLSSFVEMNIIPDGTAKPRHQAALLADLAAIQASLDRAVAKVKGLPLRIEDKDSAAVELTEDRNPIHTRPADPTCFELAREIDALYAMAPEEAGSLDRLAQVQSRLQKIIIPLQATATVRQRARRLMASVPREIWNNGCDTSVPRALRYLAEHERPGGGCQSFNSEHLYQLADEIETAVRTSRVLAPIEGARDWVTCPICREDGMERITLNDGDERAHVIHCVNVLCPSNQALPKD